MINLFHKKSVRRQGAATLIVTVVLLVLSTLIIIFSANYGIMQSKTISNVDRNSQAFEAAEAGLEFGINYLRDNQTTVLATPVNGFISFSNGSTTNVALANGSRFSVVYTNQIANDYTLITITSTGTNSEGTATRVVSQKVKFGSILFSPATAPIVSQGQITMTGNATITNTQYNTTIQSASTVSITGSGHTVLSSGTSSTAGNMQGDIQQNNTTLSNMTQSDFFATYFGNTTDVVKSQMQHVYSNSSSTNYSGQLNGLSGTSIWIDQTGGTASISGNTTIGTPQNPVLLVVNGGLSVSGNLTVYGYIFVFGENVIDSFTGNVTINGGIASTVALSMSGNIAVNYNSSTISNLQNLPAMRYYAKVPGTWKDF